MTLWQRAYMHNTRTEETEEAKLIICTCAFPTEACQNVYDLKTKKRSAIQIMFLFSMSGIKRNIL